MEICVRFPRLWAWLSYECADRVEIGDRVEIMEGTRKGMIGTVAALQRGEHQGELCICRKTSRKSDGLTWRQRDTIVKQRIYRQQFLSDETIPLVIVCEADNDDSAAEYAVYAYGTYPETSPLAGQERHTRLEPFATLTEAQEAYPRAQWHGTELEANETDLHATRRPWPSALTLRKRNAGLLVTLSALGLGRARVPESSTTGAGRGVRSSQMPPSAVAAIRYRSSSDAAPPTTARQFVASGYTRLAFNRP
jgi:hypothetical protein